MNTRLRSATVTLPNDHDILITRRFDAPAALVWRAFTEPSLLLRWWGPTWCPMESCVVDLRVGGEWRYVCRATDGAEFGWRGTYREIAPFDRLVTTEVFEGYPDAESVNTVTLVETEGVTTVQTVVHHASRANRDGHIESGMEGGMQETFDRLETMLDALTSVAGRFARVADGFSAVVAAVPADGWDAPAPCDGWRARDVVGHMVEWMPAFMSRAGLDLRPATAVDDDPAAAWAELVDAIAEAVADPEVAGTEFDGGPAGVMTVARAVDMLFVGDVLVHTWDLAKATGQDVVLEPDLVHDMLLGLQPMDEMLRASGHYGPRIDVSADASEQDRLVAFTGRTP